MMHFARLLFCLIVLSLPSSLAAAQNPHSWVVSRVTGTAFIAEKGKQALRVRRGMWLNPGQTLSTRDRSRVLLTRGAERLQAGPGAILAIPPQKYNKPGKTLVLQQSGKIELTVNKKAAQHFSVQTPYLIAVVKGTTFAVDVQQNRARVSVDTGRVEVSDNRSGRTTEVTRGQAASVSRAADGSTQMTIEAKGAQPAVRTIRSKIGAPGFYATVDVKGKTLALSPGSARQTTSVSEAKAATTASSNARSNRSFNGSANSASFLGNRSSDNNSSTDNRRGNPGNSGNGNDNPGNSGNGNGNSGNSGNGNGNSGNNGNGNGNSGNSGNGNGNSGNSGNSNGNSGNNGNGNGNSGNNGNGNGNSGNSGNSTGNSGNSGNSTGNSGNSGNSNGNSGNSGNSNGNSGNSGNSTSNSGNSGNSNGNSGNSGNSTGNSGNSGNGNGNSGNSGNGNGNSGNNGNGNGNSGRK